MIPNNDDDTHVVKGVIMGADLTIEKDRTYYRDSYGHFNSWFIIGLSYWQMSRALETKGFIDSNAYVTVKGVKFIKNEIDKRPLTDKGIANAAEEVLKHDKSFRLSAAGITDIRERDKEMREFWNKAVNLKSRVAWSV